MILAQSATVKEMAENKVELTSFKKGLWRVHAAIVCLQLIYF